MSNSTFDLIDLADFRARLDLFQTQFDSLVKEAEVKGEQLDKPWLFASKFKFEIGFSEKEQFIVSFLDNQLRVIKTQIMFSGTVNQCHVHIREIIREALLLNAVNLIIGHNHPSGELTPSKSDISLTQAITDAGKLLSIKLIDHIIVGPTADYYAFSAHHSEVLWG